MSFRRLTCLLLAIGLSLAFPLAVLAEDEANASSANRYYYDEVVNAGSKGYSQAERIQREDPHFGWHLGSFVVSGFTSRVDSDTPVFLKNVGDKVSLSFVLDQEIDALNGDDRMQISRDEDGYDEHFGVEQQDFGRGTLIVRHTDYQNSSTAPQVYVDYLPALEVGAETQIGLFEEGDYEVTLDYEVESPWVVPFVSFAHNYTNCRISFRFKVRNSNAMAFLFDTETGKELVNCSVTENGFRIDAAGSHYLEINVRRSVLSSTGDELVEDTRFNRAATDGSSFTDEGIYEVTVRNQATGEETSKTIYVGDNEVLRASVANQMGIAEVEEQLARGAAIAEDGTLMYAAVDLDVEEEPQGQAEEPASDGATVQEGEGGEDSEPAAPPGVIAAAAVALGAAGFAIGGKRKRNDDA